jgi:hypothetical protein
MSFGNSQKIIPAMMIFGKSGILHHLKDIKPAVMTVVVGLIEDLYGPLNTYQQ